MNEANRQRARVLFATLTNTGRTCDIEWLFGPRHAQNRARILSELRGEKVPKSRAGWTQFKIAMFDLFDVHEECYAAMRATLGEKAREVLK